MYHSIARLAAIAVITLVLAALLRADSFLTAPAVRQEDERLSFQTSGPWSPRVDLNADVALVYGIGPAVPRRLADWRDHGYRVHVMTGIAWGNYQDYVNGRWDGKDHHDEAQMRADGTPKMHGRDVFYMSPGDDYGNYIAAGIKNTLDAGAQAVCLEEPEFWVESGWEPNFKRQWKQYYHEDWQPPDSSPDAQYRASKLKYYLYRRALAQVFDFVHRYGIEHGRQIPCYVATHSLPNYAHWRIVSPESSLLEVGCDGYVAQVWTGTARTPNVYEGRLRERTFETAFLEYGALQNLVRASGRRVWYLNDPVEDNRNHTWADYRVNWESTLTASLLQPDVWRYEIMPWPQRIFMGRYPSADGRGRVPIPKEYETELQSVITAMGEMKQPAGATRWEVSGTQGAGVLVSDTMMFQRGSAAASDANLGSFYGLALPLLERGIPVEPVQIENATESKALDRYRLLLLSYEGQKPPTPRFHEALARWVRDGGALVVIDDDKDPFNAVREWWNTPPLSYATPREHLFKELGLTGDARGLSRVGKGVVVFAPLSPAGLTYQADGGERVGELARQAAESIGLKWKQSAALVVRRGPYLVASGLDDPAPDQAPTVLKGRFIPLFNPELPLVRELAIAPGTRQLLLDVDALPATQEGVIAAACRVRDEQELSQTIQFHADGIEGSRAVVCIRMNKPPRQVLIGGKIAPESSSGYADGILRVRFDNSAQGVDVKIER